MCPASPQSMTRCAILMPPPATFAFPVASMTPLTRPLYMHSQLNFRMLLERAAYFQRAFNRRFCAMIENQRDAVASRDCDQTACRFRGLEFIRTSNNFVQALDCGSLLMDR